MITDNGSCVGSCTDFHYSGGFFLTLVGVTAAIWLIVYIYFKLYPPDAPQ